MREAPGTDRRGDARPRRLPATPAAAALLLAIVVLSLGRFASTAIARSAPAESAPKAPGGPPLVVSPSSGSAEADAEDAGASQPGELDPLVGNGLGSPLCRGALGGGELTSASRRDCETSGFVAAAAPTGDYGLDVHIDTGLLGFSRGGVLTVVQDLFVQPVWMALVWAVHALVVMLEWGFTIDLLDSPVLRAGIGADLQRMQRAVTQPWLSLAFSCAAVLALYNGIVRRRVAETLADALVLVAMVAAAMWVTFDPSATVGALGDWANEASLGTLAATTRGVPARGGTALADSMREVFGAAVDVPWCYLEFGDVEWCRDPARLDPELHAAGLRIAAEQFSDAGCGASGRSMSACAPKSTRARGLAHSAQLLREARTNGAIFLALPANGPARNSINDAGSLLHVLCHSDQATSCHGATAAAAEFRTDGGTWPRVGGLLLIVVGLLGMLLMLGFVAARLLAAALFSLLYLLMAPAAALAPAFGDRGRDVFRRWGTELVAAVLSKLLFSFLLGLMLVVVAILVQLAALGFWTQWLLMSAFWWSAFVRREQIVAFARERGAVRRRQPVLAPRLLRSARMRGSRLSPVRRSLGLLRGPATPAGHANGFALAARVRARSTAAGQTARLLDANRRSATLRDEGALTSRARAAALRAQLARVRAARDDAAAGGTTRRVAELSHRAQRIEGELGSQQEALRDASRSPGGGRRARRSSGSAAASAAETRDRFLDAQAALPSSRERLGSASHPRRDYRALAGLVGYTRNEYAGLGPAAERAARVEIDRELALRREISMAAGDVARDADIRALPRRRRRRAESAFDRALAQRVRDAGARMPAARGESSAIAEWRAKGRTAGVSRPSPPSRVMNDARAVAERRKRQLGFGRE